MKNGSMWFGLAAVALLTSAVQAGPIKLACVPASAKWLVHADVEAFKATRMGAWILKKMDEEKAENKLAAMQAISNFDPRKDLTGVTIFGTKGGEQKEGVAVATGNFDEQRLITLLKANDSYQTVKHGARVIHSVVQKDAEAETADGDAAPGAPAEHMFGCLVSRGVLALGSTLEGVKGALDVIDGAQPALKADSALAKLMPAAPAMLFAVSSDIGDVDLGPIAEQNWSGSASLALNEANGKLLLSLSVMAKDEAAAQQMAAVVNGFVALMSLGAQKNPDAAKLAEGIRVAAEGPKVSGTAALPVDDLIRMLEQAEKKAAQPQPDGDGAAPAGL